MTALTWDAVGERFYETGVDHGVLYIPDEDGVYATGVAWNGLTSVSESPTGAEANHQYADNIMYLNLVSIEQFEGTIEAFTYPPEFDQFDGLISPEVGMTIGQQPRKPFGMCVRTRLGNDLQAEDYGFKLHLYYGLLATPSEKAYTTINDSPEAITFSWSVTSTPVPVTGYKPTSLIVVDSTTVDSDNLTALMTELYGGAGVGENPNLPTPDEVIALIGA